MVPQPPAPEGVSPPLLATSMRSLGIDFGERRIGLAVSDPEGRVAVPLTTLERRSDAQVIAEIVAIAMDEGSERLVIGEPRGPGGEEHPSSPRIRRFGVRLASATGLPVRWTDETHTSIEAERQLREAGVDLRRHRERIDALAARLLLQEVLDLERERGR